MEPDYYQIRKDANEYFMNLKAIQCPALELEVHFNSRGFNHIIYKKGNIERPRFEQIPRFQILAMAVKIISKTTTFQEFEEIQKELISWNKGRKTLKTKTISYWGLIAIIENKKIKVILRKIGNGHLHFWSIIPYYSTSPQRDGKYMRGDPEYD